MRVIVPFAAQTPKTRLEPVLDLDERKEFARVLLKDVLDAIEATDVEPTVLATAPIDLDVEVIVDERNLTPAVNAVLDESDEAVAIVMADLGLITSPVIERFFTLSGDVVLAPGMAGGTNAIVSRTGDFSVDYHGVSFHDHLAVAREIGATVNVIDSFRLATDIDEPADLLEVFLHGTGRASDWLASVGFSIDRSGDRVRLTRT